MTRGFTRRRALAVIGAAALGGLKTAWAGATLYDYNSTELPVGFNPDLLPPAESEIDFPIKTISPREVPGRYRRTVVDYAGDEAPGTVVVDPGSRHLYLVSEGGSATRYGIGVGRAGFAWAGDAVVGKKRRWPRWLPPREMAERDPNAAKWPSGQPGGPDNPLGARALYLYQGGVDTLYRIHGTNDPKSIGKAMSSGCIRLLNQDIADLYERVDIGAQVVVLAAR